MDRASSLIYPGSRILAGWWRQLQPQQPQAIQVGYGFVHRVEAPVQVLLSQPIDSLTHLILQAIALAQRKSLARGSGSDPQTAETGVELETLRQHMLLPAPVLRQILLGLENTGLVVPSASGWLTTQRGRIAIEREQYPVHAQERRVFTFVEQLQPTGARSAALQFMPVAECIGVPWTVEDSHRFDIRLLHDAIAAPADWKQRWAFPAEVEAVVMDSSVPAWQQVIVDRPERILLVLMRTGQGDGTAWLGYAVRPDGWNLYDQTPILRLSANPAGPELAEAPTPTAWQDAWRAWCRERNLPMNEAELCSLTYQPPRLEVRAPERLLQRLRAAKSDLLKGEAWLLVGDGYVRTAALLTVA